MSSTTTTRSHAVIMVNHGSLPNGTERDTDTGEYTTSTNDNLDKDAHNRLLAMAMNKKKN
ncbi:MAG: hypothetical protein AAFO96_28355 [Bacteroidota bacterium]